MKKKIMLTLLGAGMLASVCALTGAAEEETASKNLFAMDTFMTLSVEGPDAEAAIQAASAEILRLDALLSTGNEKSAVYQLNETGTGTASPEMETMLEYSRRLYEETEGCFDITIYPVMQLWGFTTGDYHVPSEEELDPLRSLLDMDQVAFDENSKEISFETEGMAIDFGAIAKGFTSSRVMEIFEEMGMTRGIINLGGNVHTFRTKAGGAYWRIAVKNPWRPEEFLGILDVADEAVITSGGYERFFEEDGQTYHHIIDPATCRPSDSGLVSVSIICKDGTLADGLSTSLFIMGMEKAQEYWRAHSDEFETILVEDDGTIVITQGLEGRFTSDEKFEVIYAD